MIEIASSARKLQDLLSTSAADKVQSIDRYESCESVVEERERVQFLVTYVVRAISERFPINFLKNLSVSRQYTAPRCTAVSLLRNHRTPAVRR